MSMKQLFERKEMKYLLNRSQKDALVKALKPYVNPDPYPDYEILSIYYDNDDYDLFRKSLEKPVYKEKLRLRSYGTINHDTDPVFFEIKKKFQGITYKRRIDLTLQEAEEFPYLETENVQDVSRREIQKLIHRYNLHPVLFISYHRQAWMWKENPDLRITIDDQIQYRTEDLNLQKGRYGKPLFNEDMYILEIKDTLPFPLVLIRLLESLDIQPCSISKAGLAYKQLLKGGQIYGHLNHAAR